MVKCDADDVKKGPWKPEEDQILINHVKKYGPRAWSSIRSKGLLMRTGKSCRLRWVNKLRPDLKSGVKFTLEEEKLVIDLQAQFGNKWAKIATYLTGRTDNDVKNFWSGRQKRLARIRDAPIECPKITTYSKAPVFHHEVHSTEGIEINSSGYEGYVANSQSCSSNIFNTLRFELLPLPELMHPNCENTKFQSNEKQPDFGSLTDPLFMDVFEQLDEAPLAISHQPPLGANDLSNRTGETDDNRSILAADNFMNDFQSIEMFDEIELFPSPSNWI